MASRGGRGNCRLLAIFIQTWRAQLTSARPRIRLARGAISGGGKHCHPQRLEGELDAEKLVGCDGVLAWCTCGARSAAAESGLCSLRKADFRRGKTAALAGSGGDH